jgi:HPr kinase/phosphorylase
MTRPPVHGSCVAIDGRGVLLLGPPGSGKSDLALRLIDCGALLVADDQVVVARNGPGEIVGLTASAPDQIRGLLEVRGVGIVTVETAKTAPLFLAAELVAPDRVDRLPETATWRWRDVDIPLISISPFQASAPAKLRLAVRALSMNDGAMTGATACGVTDGDDR